MPQNNKAPYDVLYEDEDIVVVYKKRDVFSVSTNDPATFTHNLFQYLQWRANRNHEKVLVVHRLDYETSGVMIFAKKPEVKERLQAAFEARKVGRFYEAVIQEKIPLGEAHHVEQYLLEEGPRVSVSDAEHGKLAITDIAASNYIQIGTALAISIGSGRHNQIRLALKSLNYTLLGDKRFADNTAKRLYLNAYKLSFPAEVGLKKSEFIVTPLWLDKLPGTSAPAKN
jgi:Pseudouridylate synthases, 23S RNA-specific